MVLFLLWKPMCKENPEHCQFQNAVSSKLNIALYDHLVLCVMFIARVWNAFFFFCYRNGKYALRVSCYFAGFKPLEHPPPPPITTAKFQSATGVLSPSCNWD